MIVAFVVEKQKRLIISYRPYCSDAFAPGWHDLMNFSAFLVRAEAILDSGFFDKVHDAKSENEQSCFEYLSL